MASAVFHSMLHRNTGAICMISQINQNMDLYNAP